MMQLTTIFFGQGLLQIGELLLAFALSALVGLERQLRGRSVGLRTQAIVGTSSALFMLVSLYGFNQVSGPDVKLDPSRVAAQIVSGIGFLGAGLILTRRGAVRGLTTAASVWETAAIGMAAGGGLWLLALVVTALHFISTYGFRPITRRLPGSRDTHFEIEVVYADGRGLLRDILSAITTSGWTVHSADPHSAREGTAALMLELSGATKPDAVIAELTAIDGVRSVELHDQQDFE